jgi:hypothetical protein
LTRRRLTRIGRGLSAAVQPASFNSGHQAVRFKPSAFYEVHCGRMTAARACCSALAQMKGGGPSHEIGSRLHVGVSQRLSKSLLAHDGWLAALPGDLTGQAKTAVTPNAKDDRFADCPIRLGSAVGDAVNPSIAMKGTTPAILSAGTVVRRPEWRTHFICRGILLLGTGSAKEQPSAQTINDRGLSCG